MRFRTQAMSYLLESDPQNKAIPVKAPITLYLHLERGRLSVLRHQHGYLKQPCSLISIPKTKQNLKALGIQGAKHETDQAQDWIVPPFKINNTVFSKGSAFTYFPNESTDKIDDLSNATVELAEDEQFRPDLGLFIPTILHSNIPENCPPREIDRTDWNLKKWIGGQSYEQARSNERNLIAVPWDIVGLSQLDLWLEQYRCWELNLPVPKIPRPIKNLKIASASPNQTPQGLTIQHQAFDESHGALDGEHELRLEIVEGSEIDRIIAKHGFTANGFFLDGILKLISQDESDPLVWKSSPDGQGASFISDQKTISSLLRLAIVKLCNLNELASIMKYAKSVGFEPEF